MNFQESQNYPSISVDASFAMLRLSSATNATSGQLSDDQCHSCGSHKKSTKKFSAAAVKSEMADLVPEKNTLYGGGSNKVKRYSNCRFSSSLEEPFPKRTATLYGGATAGEPISSKNNHRGVLPVISKNDHFQGFMNIPLLESPVTPSPAAKPPLPPPLYRTISDPTGSSSYPRRKSKNGQSSTTMSTLARTASWSPNEYNFKNGESSTTMKSANQCALARTASCSPNTQDLGGVVNNGESPTAMRLKRMRDGMREMRQWCDLMIQEEETSHEENKTVKDDEADTGGGEPFCEEAVWVERMGSCLILHFKCPCGKGYQILLCGNNCYYKLTNF
ncbi:hypothetical protein P3L10_031274 [Capsicum annuum]|uniref:uncharacterized protein LOC107847181 n=1 Tax=Capsicum annuum TaxID=4072 RepID=UPI0007BEF6BA|nr:uncharacterized protein LOC107847181 [Capsicum annuum]